MLKKKIVFLTGTRADFGKLKSLITISENSSLFDIYVFVTGMHMNSLYGFTVDEVEKSGFKNIYKFINHSSNDSMDKMLAKTINGFSEYIKEIKPDLIVVHGDRIEALAGSIVGSLNNILVSHIEGGEVSGTIDELIRHSVSKMSHIHLVSNEDAKSRLIQLGEYESSIFVLGSPDFDLMDSKKIPSLNKVKKYYDINFNDYAIAMYHPVTTEYENISNYTKNFTEALIESNINYILIYPNNDLGSKEILNEYDKLLYNKKIKIFPSLRFEYFLRLLKDSRFIIGNSSAGIREAPFYNIRTIDIGSRQKNRAKINTIINSSYKKEEILYCIKKVINSPKLKHNPKNYFGEGKSDQFFLKLIKSKKLWKINHQKQFQDI